MSGGQGDTSDRSLTVPDRFHPHRQLCQAHRVEPRQLKYWPKAGAATGPAHEGCAAGYRQGFAVLPALPPPSGAGRSPGPAALPLCRTPCRGCPTAVPPAGRGVLGGARSAVRLLGRISGLITARLRARRGASTLPDTCPTWALPTALPRSRRAPRPSGGPQGPHGAHQGGPAHPGCWATARGCQNPPGGSSPGTAQPWLLAAPRCFPA